MDDGRLDEAFALADDPAVRRHRRGQELTGRLAQALLARCRAHLDGGSLSQALADSDKAARLAGATSEVAAAQSAVAEAMADRRRAADQRAADATAARRHMDEGRLTLAAAGLGDDDEPDRRELARRRDEAADAAGRVQEALDRGDWAAAADELLAAADGRIADSRLKALAAHAADLLGRQIRSTFESGRPDRAALLAGRLERLAATRPETEELLGLLDQTRRAAALLNAGRSRPAGEILRRLATICPDAAWLPAAAEQCELAAAAVESLRAGPLGLLPAGGADADDAPAESVPAAPSIITTAATPPHPTADPRPDRFLMRIDGVGAFLVVRQNRVTVGPISSPERPTVGLPIDPTAPAALFERVDEDYFLLCDRPLDVNGAAVTDALLTGGERIALTGRCRLTFTRPHAASTSAVLRLSGARLPAADAEAVILLDRDLVIAGGPAAHIRAEAVEAPLVLVCRDGRLRRPAGATAVADGRTIGAAEGLPMNTPLQIGPIRMTLSEIQ